MTNLFEPKNGVAQWRTVYEQLITMNVEDVITDETLTSLLSDAAEGSIKPAFHRAVREMETERSRSFIRVRNVGYRMVEAREHEGLAQDQHRKARRRLKAAGRKLISADRSRLTADEKARFTALEIHVSQQQDMLRRLSVKQTELQKVQVKTSGDVAELSGKVDRLTSLLNRHGIGVDAAVS